MPGTVIQARSLVRAQPYGAQVTYIQSPVANPGGLEASFDLAVVITEPAQFESGNFGTTTIPAVGPYLDMTVFSTGIGTVDIQVAIDYGASTESILAAPLAVAANVMFVISALRIPARFVNASFTNTSGGAVTVDFGAFIRSN